MMNQLARLPWELAGSKVQERHLGRLAVVYVRQSTMAQVIEHGESTRLQYGLSGRAADLGWEASRVLVIDEDLGHSASGAEVRPGFQRLVSEVGLDHVGIVLGIEMSRLARSGREWHQLLELCALSGTLLGDMEAVYDPNAHNDRPLLGLKGTISRGRAPAIALARHRARPSRAGLQVRGRVGLRSRRGRRLAAYAGPVQGVGGEDHPWSYTEHITGFVVLSDHDEDGSYEAVSHIWTASKWRRKGIAQQLLTEAKSRFEFTEIEQPYSPDGDAFLKSCGYVK
jgi:DNA invertase Pin-like site-specific DNA recombinase